MRGIERKRGKCVKTVKMEKAKEIRAGKKQRERQMMDNSEENKERNRKNERR